jgi:hypothetical protein
MSGNGAYAAPFSGPTSAPYADSLSSQSASPSVFRQSLVRVQCRHLRLRQSSSSPSSKPSSTFIAPHADSSSSPSASPSALAAH